MEPRYMDRFTEQGKVVATLIVKGINENGGKARLGVTWMDISQRWAWETILAHSKSLNMDYQLIDPREFEKMNEGKITTEEIQAIIKRGM